MCYHQTTVISPYIEKNNIESSGGLGGCDTRNEQSGRVFGGSVVTAGEWPVPREPPVAVRWWFGGGGSASVESLGTRNRDQPPLQPQPMGTHRLAHGALARQFPVAAGQTGIRVERRNAPERVSHSADCRNHRARGGTDGAHGTRTRAGGRLHAAAVAAPTTHPTARRTWHARASPPMCRDLASSPRFAGGLMTTVDECHAPATQTPFSRERARTALGDRILSGGVFFFSTNLS